MNKIISIANFKGGVGKTTSCLNIGAGIAKRGHKVLLIDLDAQFNLTQSLGVTEPAHAIDKALTGEENLQPIQIEENLFLLPSRLEIIKAEIQLYSAFKREEKLSKLLQSIKNKYDFIFIDCPPSLGLLTINAFVASDFIYVPIEAEFLALKGYSILSEALLEIGLEIDKVFITKYDRRKVLNRNVETSIKKALGNKAFKTVIRENVALAEAPTSHQSIFDYAPNSHGAEDYSNLINEILNNK